MSTEMIWVMRSTGSEDTENLGEALGQLLQAPITIELISDLGGGKTTFVRGLVLGLGSTDLVSSPTFTLSKVYKVKAIEINHFDLYRLSEPGIIKDELQESLEDQNAITIIEWSDTVKESLPEVRIKVKFLPVANDSDEREVYIIYHPVHQSIIKIMQTNWEEVRV